MFADEVQPAAVEEHGGERGDEEEEAVEEVDAAAGLELTSAEADAVVLDDVVGVVDALDLAGDEFGDGAEAEGEFVALADRVEGGREAVVVRDDDEALRRVAEDEHVEEDEDVEGDQRPRDVGGAEAVLTVADGDHGRTVICGALPGAAAARRPPATLVEARAGSLGDDGQAGSARRRARRAMRRAAARARRAVAAR